jgi:probable addiction module antidote protein
MTLETARFDASEHLDNPEVIAAYISEALESNDPAFIAAAIGDVARAYGMSAIADAAGVSRGSLYRGLSQEGNPELSTVLNVLRAVGLRLTAKPAAKAAAKPPSQPKVKPAKPTKKQAFRRSHRRRFPGRGAAVA